MFQKLYLLFRKEWDSSLPDEKDLCDIFTSKLRADAECEERNKRHGDKYVSYHVEEWEVQE